MLGRDKQGPSVNQIHAKLTIDRKPVNSNWSFWRQRIWPFAAGPEVVAKLEADRSLVNFHIAEVKQIGPNWALARTNPAG